MNTKQLSTKKTKKQKAKVETHNPDESYKKINKNKKMLKKQ